jgi:hypothetical protein
VVNGLTMTCKFPVWHSWEGPETASGAYGFWGKPAYTVHVVNNFSFGTPIPLVGWRRRCADHGDGSSSYDNVRVAELLLCV